MTSFRDVVATHHRDSDAVLVAGREPCITIAHDEQANVGGRRFTVVGPDRLDALELGSSWIMAVLLCAGDRTDEVADWVRTNERDPRRVVFYIHAEADARDALDAWYAAGLPVHSMWTVETWRELHKHFGAAWNLRVFDDFRWRP